MKAAQEQNKALQEKITKMTESAKETQKINKEQNDSLQAQLKTITEANRKQGEDLTKKIGEMQGSITSLTEINSMLSKDLLSANTAYSDLKKKNSNYCIMLAISFAALILLAIIYLLHYL